MANSILNIAEFTISRRLGVGARSTIYLAKDNSTNMDIALKRVIHEQPEDHRIFEQCKTEYRTAMQIDSPYVRKCYKLKKIRKMLKVKEILLSMELLDGETLEKSPTLSLLDILLVFRMTATGLLAMHQKSFVHCDIKPNNIVLTQNGNIKIIDLGQSCTIGTVKKRIQGTPDYIAPEQVHRKPLGPRTDIFNLGATMYWAFTGQNIPTLIPKKNNSLTDIAPKKYFPPHVLQRKIPLSLSNLVSQCVKEDPLERPAGMNDIIKKLDAMIHEITGGKLKNNKNAAKNN
ncbi:MAG: serine/threonine protein kinase [Phycisphaerae bacterium]|nr:serine/threonine protein kinase [Phycisphaerae bacterium]